MPKVNIDPQSVKLQKEEKSLQLKNRIKRQYNPSDINIAKLFLAIREHRTGNPQLNKISEIEGLLTQVQNINDIDLNDIGNTPLHVAVSKKHPDIVEFLLNVPGIDPNIQNNQGDTSLEPVHNLFRSKAAKARTTICRLVLSFRSQFFHNRLHFCNQAKDLSTTHLFGNTTKVCNSFRFITSTVAPIVAFICVAKFSPV